MIGVPRIMALGRDRRIALCVRTACTALLLVWHWGSLHAAGMVLERVHIVDLDTGETTPEQYVVIREGRIESVSSNAPDAGPERRLDLDGKWVLPGLVDMHTHLDMAGAPSPWPATSTAARALLALKNAGSMLESGFTTVRDLGGQGYAVADLDRAIENGLFVGPTIIGAGKFIIPFGAGRSVSQKHLGPIPLEAGHVWTHSHLTANTPWEMVAAVRENIYYGAEVIKLIADQNPYHFSLDEIKAAVDEAHEAGMTVAVHAGGGHAARNAILAGADTIEHGFDLDDELLRLMKKHGTALGTTDFSREMLMHIFQGNAEAARPWGEKIVNRLRRAHALGVLMVFGTDTIFELDGMTRGETAIGFISTWKTAGIPALETLRAMTINSYRVLHMDHERGRVAPGFYADLVVVGGNPLTDIEVLRSPLVVFKEGREVQPSGRQPSAGP
jgi:imidazolonepropionase-like amidohydrolase